MPILLKLGLDGRIPLNAERINAMFIGMPDDCINCGKVHEPGECEGERSLNDQPWPLRDIVLKLCEAAEILLHGKDYDEHGHEQIAHALKLGREWSSRER